MMKHIAKRTIVVLAALAVPLLLGAVPASPEAFEVLQPDGTPLLVRLVGDENAHYMQTADGCPVVQTADGWYEYAQAAGDRLQASGVAARNAHARSLRDRRLVKRLSQTLPQPKAAPRMANGADAPQRFPLQGSPQSLVILVEFTNKKFVITEPQAKFTALLNEKGYSQNGGTGSARDYFSDNSYGNFTPEFVVVGPVQLDNPYNYYGENDKSGDKRSRQMIIDACRKADTLGVNFADYDTDGDGVVDNVFVYYAGYNEAEGGGDNTIWPHRWKISTLQSLKIDGVYIDDYACTSELRGNSGSTMCGIGTFVHEFGHVLGLPDFYPTDGSEHTTLRSWDVMDYGPYNNNGRTPPAYSAYERFFLGWLKPTLLKDPTFVTLDTLTVSNEACIITQTRAHNLSGTRPSPNQFFMLENRQKKGWDTYLPAHGLLVTRVNYNSTKWNYNTVNNDPTNMCVAIMAAYPSAFNTTSDTYPGSRNVTVYRPVLNSGEEIGQALTYIEEKNGIVSFRYDGGGDGFPSYDEFPASLDMFTTIQQVASDSQSVAVRGRWIDEPLKVSLKSGEKFQIAIADSAKTPVWGSSLTFAQSADSLIDATLLVRYFPEIASFCATDRDTILLVKDKYTTLEITISGKSTRPVLVEVPVATEATDTTSSSFVAHWDAAFDATGYYLSVYAVSEGTSTLVEGFDNYSTSDSVPLDWESSLDVVNTVIFGDAAPSLVFTENSDTLVTERYIFPIDSIGFWLHGMSATGSLLKIEALDSVWSPVDSLVITTATKRTTVHFALPAGNAYTRFRITYQKKDGKVLFDDFTVYFAQNVEYKLRHQFVDSLRYSVEDLNFNTEYRYRLQATDKTEYYENITDFSNEISTKTSDAICIFTNPSLKVFRLSDNTYEVQLDSVRASHHLYVYTIDGRLLADIKVGDTEERVKLPLLPVNNVYLLKYSPEKGRRRNDPSAKILVQPF